MSTQRIQTFLLLAGITTAVVILVLFLLNWNSALDREVKRRIREIDESNKQLSEANEQLKVHDKMQSEFINIAAHELRTPIQPILGLTNFLLSKKGNIESYKDFLNIVSRNAKRLQRLTEDILDVTRIESHSLKLNKEQFNLNDIIVICIDDITTNRYSNNGENNGAVKILYEPKDIFVHADKERIAQVVSNLLHNAVKFTNEGGRGRRGGGEGEGSISVSSNRSTDKNEITVCVRDSGTGIDPEVLPKLFSKFVSKSARGTGLGLFVSKSIIEAHGGRIWAQNNQDGERRGATFAFSIPISNDPNKESWNRS
jgi:signal transduction histidine kinase